MGDLNILNISIFVFQGLILFSLLLFLYQISDYFGKGLLYTTLGLTQFLQVFLSDTFIVQFAPGSTVASGSILLFSSALFVILLIYIKDDAVNTRVVIYAIVFANFLVVAFLYLFDLSKMHELSGVTVPVFQQNFWVMILGTSLLWFDAVLLIWLYELVSKIIRSLYFRIGITMFIVLSLDHIIYSFILWFNMDLDFNPFEINFLTKAVVVLLYSAVLYIYIKFINKNKQDSTRIGFKDFFHTLTYRQKYELVAQEKAALTKESQRAIKASEKRFRTLTKISPVGIFQTDVSGKTTYVNPTWCEISGLSFEDAMNDGWLVAVHPEDRNDVKSGWYHDVGDKSDSRAAYRFLHHNGEIRWVLGQVVPEYNPDNEIIGYVGTITDITALKQYEIELDRAKKQAEESSNLKSSFLQNMSHEIRTPMNAISGFANLIMQLDLPKEELKEYIHIIYENTNQLLSIFNDILTISALDTMQEQVNIEELGVNTLLNTLWVVHSKQMPNKKVALVVNLPNDTKELTLHTDKTKLTQILTNLLNNAKKFTKSGTISFGYTLELNYIKFFVIDTGMGIEANKHKLIFDRFRQLNDDKRSEFGGTGLGLSISKGFVELLGGNIWVESEIGKGSEFYFTLPL